MGVPRIMFTRFERADSAKLEPWREHRRRVLGVSAGATRVPQSDAPAMIWQLVSANNRELARGADVFDDFRDAVQSANEAVEASTFSSIVAVSDERDGGYGWYLKAFDRPVVVCARWYMAERERRQAVRVTLESLPLAQLATGARRHTERATVAERNFDR